MTQRMRGGVVRAVLLTLLALALVAAGLLWQRYQRFVDAPLAGAASVQTLVVARGDTLPSVLAKLRAEGVEVGDSRLWKLLARQLATAGKLQVGEYALDANTSPRQLLLAMHDGRVVARKFTIVDGWNIRELRAALRKVPMLEQRSADLSDAELMRQLGHPGEHPEGRFLPETYAWVKGDSDLDLLRHAYAAMSTTLADAWKSRAPELPLKSADEALVLASIIEKETGVADERAQIAGVFTRRLKSGMRLQTDPTVIYGMGSSYAGNLRRSDLTTDTPYNTYTRDGLPPTPIAMPGKPALIAATHPAAGDALFFVAVGDGSGRHVFTKSLGEHNAAVREYVARYRAQQAASQ